MKQLQEQRAEELVTMTEAEVEAVSGAKSWLVDLGPLGIFQFSGDCVKYTLVSDCGTSWATVKEC